MITITNLSPEDWRAWRELRLQALADAPHAFGSTLGEWQGDGDTENRWRNRLVSVPLNVIAHLDDAAAGMVGATALDPALRVELISMWVAPFARGRGVGDALVQAVVDWSRAQQARRLTLDVMASNAQAIALYRRHGFTLIDGPAANGACERMMARDL